MARPRYIKKKGEKLKGCYRVTVKKPKSSFAKTSFRMVVHGGGKSAVLVGKLKNSKKTSVHESLKRVKADHCSGK